MSDLTTAQINLLRAKQRRYLEELQHAKAAGDTVKVIKMRAMLDALKPYFAQLRHINRDGI